MATISSSEVVEKFRRINFTKISDVQLTKWIREATSESYGRLSLMQSLCATKLIREAYRLGEIRGKSVK